MTNSLLQQQAYIDGQWVDACNGQKFKVYNPSDDRVLAEIADVGAEDAKRAIAAADQTFSHWSQLDAGKRGEIMRAWGELVRNNVAELAQLLTLEQGKPLQQAQIEVEQTIAIMMRFSTDAQGIAGQCFYQQQADGEAMSFTLKQAVGVVAIVMPWNLPFRLLTTRCAAAIAAGCTVVVKPAQDTPLSALALAKLAEEAGLPAGVLNVLPCQSPRAVGEVFCQSPSVRKLAFTGSTATGKLLLSQCADTVKNVCLELGGNAPFIIFADADLEKALEEGVSIKSANSGQICINVNRFLVEDSIYETFVQRFVERFSAIKVGNGMDKSSTMGPLINEAAVAKVDALVKRAVEQGASLLLGGNVLPELGRCFYQPTVLSEATPEMDIADREIFGPVAVFFRFHGEEQGIALANNTEYGLIAYAYTQDGGRALRLSRELEAGMVLINRLTQHPLQPFGGVKQSGIGREGGPEALDSYCETKSVSILL